MTEKEKMLSGQLYDPSDEELSTLRLRARRLARQYNQTDEADGAALGAILEELLPNGGRSAFFQPPVYFDYGCNTHIGQYCMANFNLVVLDCAPVHIGDNVKMGPNCTLATPMHLGAVGLRKTQTTQGVHRGCRCTP